MAIAPTSPGTADALLRLGRERDPEAWSRLVETHGERVRCLAHRMIDDDAMAEDAAQNAFLAMRDSAPGFVPSMARTEEAAVGWVMRVAWTAITRTARDRRRRMRRERPLAVEPLVEDAGGDLAPICASALQDALARLPDGHRQALSLHYQAELPYPELAAALRITVEAARMRVHRALVALRHRVSGAIPSVAALDAALQGAPRPPPSPSACAAVRGLLNSTRHAPSGAALIMTTASILGIAAIATAIAVVIGRAPAAESQSTVPPAPVPAQAPATAVDPGTLMVHVEFSEETVDGVAGFFQHVLRVPLSIDPAVNAAEPPPITLQADRMSVQQVLDTICRLTNLNLVRQDHGGLLLTTVPGNHAWTAPPDQGAGEAEANRTITVEVHDVTGKELAREFARASGRGFPPAFAGIDDAGLGTISIRGALEPRHDALLQAALGGRYCNGPYARRLSTAIDLPAFSGSVADAFALIARLSGLGMRIDDQSGPMPRIAFSAARLPCERALASIARAAHAQLSQASDGMVLFRPARRCFADGQGHHTDAQGVDYSQHKKPWWWYQQLASGPAIAIAAQPGDRMLRPQWRETPLAAVAADLRRQLGLALEVRLDASAAAKPILLAMGERTLDQVLVCLSFASACRWSLTSDGAGITVDPDAEQVQQVVAPSRAMSPPAPSPGQAPAPAAAATPAIISQPTVLRIAN